MSFRIRLFALTAVLAVTTAAAAAAQRGMTRTETFRIRRPAYSYFKYRIPDMALRSRLDVAQRAMERTRERQRATLERQFAMRDRLQERARKTQELTLRRSLEARERAMERVRERMDRVRVRPFTARRYWRTI